MPDEAKILALTEANSSFSKQVPGLQLAVDSTSLGEFKTCPQKYYYTIIEGWRPRDESVDLTFGLLYHAVGERYEHAQASGRSHDEATLIALRWLMNETWNHTLGRPWLSPDPNKNRRTLVRAFLWHLEQFGENDPLETLILANGKPAVELSFTLDLGIASVSGEPFMLCGHLDRIALMNGEPTIVDKKTTKGALTGYFFNQYSPDNQMSTYSCGGRIVYEQPIRMIIVDAVKVGEAPSFARGIVERSLPLQEEWIEDTKFWLGQMQQSALALHWPKNDKSCGHWRGNRADGSFKSGCDFREVCSAHPAMREQILKANFVRRTWDPLQRRGDV